MKYIEADRLRAEIDKRYAEYRAKMKTDDFTYYEGMADALDFFEQYIDSLPEQLVEGLEEEMDEMWLEYCEDVDYLVYSSIARHFAEWGADHLRSVTKMVHDGLEEAAEKCAIEYAEKEMPKDADGEIWRVGDVMIENRMSFEDGFKAGAKWMEKQGWISVDEKLPEMGEEVIVLTDELGTASIYKISFGHIVDVERCIDYNGWNIPGVKYWMPCPEIPNE